MPDQTSQHNEYDHLISNFQFLCQSIGSVCVRVVIFVSMPKTIFLLHLSETGRLGEVCRMVSWGIG